MSNRLSKPFLPPCFHFGSQNYKILVQQFLFLFEEFLCVNHIFFILQKDKSHILHFFKKLQSLSIEIVCMVERLASADIKQIPVFIVVCVYHILTQFFVRISFFSVHSAFFSFIASSTTDSSDSASANRVEQAFAYTVAFQKRNIKSKSTND